MKKIFCFILFLLISTFVSPAQFLDLLSVSQHQIQTPVVWTYYATEFNTGIATNNINLFDGNSNTITVSVWVKMGANSTNGANYSILTGYSSGNVRFRILRNDDNALRFDAYNSGADIRVTLVTANQSVTKTAGWNHWLFSCNVNNINERWSYLNGTNTGTWTYSNTNVMALNYSVPTWKVGSGTLNQLYGSLSEIFVHNNIIDLSVSENRAKFTDGTHPIDLGIDGSLPFGISPGLYLHNPYNTFGTNAGSGGDFIIDGTLSDDTSKP